MLKAGDRLPATRILAAQLGMARTTIVESFERLVAEGLLETRVGAGTLCQPGHQCGAPGGAAAEARPSRRPVPGLPSPWRLLPAASPSASPTSHGPSPRRCRRLTNSRWHNGRASRPSTGASSASTCWAHPDPLGYRPLREAIASHLRTNRGIACTGEQICVVAGAQQAFQLIGGALLDPGDKLWFENPGAIGACNSLLLSGADLVPVPVDDAGLNVERGLELAPDFTLAFVTPSHQQPLGTKMSLERRFALLDARRARRQPDHRG